MIGLIPSTNNMLPLGIAASSLSDHYSQSSHQHQQTSYQLQHDTILNNNNDNHSHRSNYSSHSAVKSMNSTAAINIPIVPLIPPIPLTTSVTAVQPLQNTFISVASDSSLVTSIPPSVPTSISIDRRDTHIDHHSDHGRAASTVSPSLAHIFGTVIDSTTATTTTNTATTTAAINSISATTTAILPINISIADDSDIKEKLTKQGYIPLDKLNNNNNNDNNRSRISNQTNKKTTIRSVSVPNLYKKSSSSSIHVSTGSMSTRLSAASRYKTATNNDDDDDQDDRDFHNDDHDDDGLTTFHPLSDQLKHSTVASMIESQFNPEPKKIFYEYPITQHQHHQNPQNYTSSSQSKEQNTSYTAVKYPTSNHQPWYPSSASSSQQYHHHQEQQQQYPAHQKEKTNQLRLAAATALRIKQHLALSPEERKHMKKVRPRYGVSKSASATTISKSLKEYPFINNNSTTTHHHHHSHEYSTNNRDVGNDIIVDENNDDLTEMDKKSSEAVQRLTQENWRLFRKYERLERSIDELKGFKDHMYGTSTDKRDRSPSPSSIKSSGRGRGGGRSSDRIGIGIDHNYDPHHVNGLDRNREENLDIADDKHDIDRNDVAGDDVDDSTKVPWQLQIEKALLQIAIENKKLTERVSNLCYSKLFAVC